MQKFINYWRNTFLSQNMSDGNREQQQQHHHQPADMWLWAKVLFGEKGKENPNVWKNVALVHNMSNKLK
jgi:hypothetical protein